VVTKKKNKYGDLPPVMQRQAMGSRLIFLAIVLLVAVFFIIDPMNWFAQTPLVEQELIELNENEEE